MRRVYKNGVIFSVVFFMSGCGMLTSLKAPPAFWSKILTDPPGAEIYLDGRFACISPCRLKEPTESPEHIYTIEASKVRYQTKTVEYPNCNTKGCSAIPRDVFIWLSKPGSETTREVISSKPPVAATPIKTDEAPPEHPEENPENERLSVEMSGELTGVIQGLANSKQQESANGNRGDFSLTGDLYFELASPVEGDDSFALVHLRYQEGRIATDSIGETTAEADQSALDSNDSSINMLEAYYEATLLDERLSILFGKMGPTTSFDQNEFANDKDRQFLASDFIYNTATDFPDYAPGVSLGFSPFDFFSITFGSFEGDSDFNNVFDYPFNIAEAIVKTKFGNLAGNYRVSVWDNKSQRETISDPDVTGTNRGIGISIDQAIGDEIGIFARFGLQDEKVSDFSQAESFGIQIKDMRCACGERTLGIAYGLRHPGVDYEESTGFDSSEGHLEVYYAIAIHEQLRITPDLQWIKHPLGDKDGNDIFVYGVRFNFNF